MVVVGYWDKVALQVGHPQRDMMSSRSRSKSLWFLRSDSPPLTALVWNVSDEVKEDCRTYLSNAIEMTITPIITASRASIANTIIGL